MNERHTEGRFAPPYSVYEASFSNIARNADTVNQDRRLATLRFLEASSLSRSARLVVNAFLTLEANSFCTPARFANKNKHPIDTVVSAVNYVKSYDEHQRNKIGVELAAHHIRYELIIKSYAMLEEQTRIDELSSAELTTIKHAASALAGARDLWRS